MSEETSCECDEPSATAVRWLRALKLLVAVLTALVGLWKAVGSPGL